MKKILYTIFIVFFILSGIFLGVKFATNLSANKSLNPLKETANQITQPQIANPLPSQSQPSQTQSQPEIPVRLIIPVLGINTNVESIGLDNQNRMDVPKNVNNVGWYSLGYKPGEKGSAVIDGHFDSSTGPAVFIDLAKLQVGDQIIVKDQKGQEFSFIVTGKNWYKYNEVPLNQIFGPSDKPSLNLITCDGVFDRNNRNYSQRLVVYSVQA